MKKLVYLFSVFLCMSSGLIFAEGEISEPADPDLFCPTYIDLSASDADMQVDLFMNRVYPKRGEHSFDSQFDYKTAEMYQRYLASKKSGHVTPKKKMELEKELSARQVEIKAMRQKNNCR